MKINDRFIVQASPSRARQQRTRAARVRPAIHADRLANAAAAFGFGRLWDASLIDRLHEPLSRVRE